MKKRNSLRILSLLVILILMASAVGCQKSEPAVSSTGEKAEAKAEDINIAFFVCLSGSQVEVGEMSKRGGLLAAEDIKAKGGIKALNGANINLIVVDITSDPGQAPTIVERTLSQQKISGAIGCGPSQMTLSILPIMEKYGVPLLTSSCSDNICEQGYSYVFQFAPKGTQFGETQIAMLSYLKDKFNLPVNKVGFVYENSSWGISTAAGLLEKAKADGFEIVLDQSYPTGITDATPLVTAVKASGAEVVFPVSYTVDAQLIITTMYQMGVHPMLIGGGSGFIWPEIKNAIGDKVNGIFSVGSWSWDAANISSDPEKVDVTTRYKEKYGTFMPEQAGEHYSMVWIYKEVLEKAASTDSKVLRDTMVDIKITEGLATIMQPGIIEFDDTQYNYHTYPTMIQWQDGEPRTVFPEAVKNVDVIWPIDNK